jgi:excisionase family DNA binding protein
MTRPDWPALMDAQTAAAYLSVSADTLKRETTEGSLPTVTVRSLTRWPRTDLDAYIERLRRAS